MSELSEKFSEFEGELLNLVGNAFAEKQKEIERLEAERDAKQARIDELMLEYCPDEMTTEQLEEWGEHQTPVING